MDLFKCPVDAALTTIPKQTCNFKIGQVVKIAFGRIGSAAPFTPTTILTKTAWDALVTANDATKIVVTNYINNVVIPSTEAVEDGGETNVNRMPELMDGGNAIATFSTRGISAAVRAAMKKLTQYSAIQPGVSELGVMFLNVDGDIICDETNVWIPVYNFFLGDSDVVAEKGKSNSATGKFTLTYGWSDKLTKYTPAFNILAAYPSA